MTFLKTIHTDLTPLQSQILDRLRPYLPDFTEEDLCHHVVAKGLLAIDADLPDEIPEEDVIDGSFEKPVLAERYLEDSISIELSDSLRQRLELLLRARPGIEQEDAVVILLELGLESLVQLGVLRRKDISLPAHVGGAS